MGESTNPRATLRFDRHVRLEFRGATITSDAGLLACRELDDALGLTETANECLQESRGGRNVQHRLVGLLRQSVYSRLAGYEDTNDAERLAQDPTMRIIVGRRKASAQDLAVVVGDTVHVGAVAHLDQDLAHVGRRRRRDRRDGDDQGDVETPVHTGSPCWSEPSSFLSAMRTVHAGSPNGRVGVDWITGIKFSL